MFSVAIHGILTLNYVFEFEDYFGGINLFKKIFKGHPCEGSFSHFREKFSGFAMVLN